MPWIKKQTASTKWSVNTKNLQIQRALFYFDLKNVIYHLENYNETGSTNNSNLKELA